MFFFFFFVNHVEETHKKIESIRLTEAIIIPLEREGTKADIHTCTQTYTSPIEATALRAWPKNTMT